MDLRQTMSMSPVVSIVMPAFNSSRFIEASISSVLRQEFQGWELLVVDGGSCDSTRDIVDRFAAADHRVRLVPNHNDRGPAHARATGVRQARGEYVAFLDADDLWLRTKLSNQIAFMCRTGTDFSYTQYRVMNSQGTEVSCPISIRRQYTYPSYLFLRGIGCSTVVIKRNLFSEEILETYGLWHGEDTLWWLKLLRAGAHARGVFEPLVLYRDAEGSLSKHRLRNQASVWRIYRDDFYLSLVTASAAYVSYVTDVALRRFRYRLCTKVFGKRQVSEVQE
jgi:teichuronic acid biosynthesis glycosyltransferase TuaG